MRAAGRGCGPSPLLGRLWETYFPSIEKYFVSLQQIMRRLCLSAALTAMVLLLFFGCRSRHAEEIDLRLRGMVDNYNKTSFINRYQDPSCAIHEAYDALALLRDSLPQYTDGFLRAYNNLAFEYYMLAERDSAAAYVDSVVTLAGDRHAAPAKNGAVERVIAQLTRIRLLQRSCNIAESYQLLYDIERSSVLRKAPDNYLYAFAQMEYYITSLTLNYHYRNNAVASSSGTQLDRATQLSLEDLLNEVEEARSSLRCDYAEDLSLNYAIAHAYYRLSAVSGSDPGLLARAYDYLIRNLRILSSPGHYSEYHLANVYQLQAFIVADSNIVPEAYYQHCCKELAELDSLGAPLAPSPWQAEEEYGSYMFRISTELFFQTADPYQHLGAVVAAAEYCLGVGDTLAAADYYALALADSSWHDGMAPKFESMLYDGLIRMGFSDNKEVNQQWYARQMQLLTFIRENESADVSLQDLLMRSETRNRYYVVVILLIGVSLVVLGIFVVLLRRRAKLLKQEKLALQEAKRKDVERIANVETCLSVLRHDINPFLSYLTNPHLPDEMRQEVLQQLLRTFANIKSWTNLSIPSGMQFRLTQFALDEVFAAVADSCPRPHPEVALICRPTELMVNGDRQLVEILLRQLVNNALQHTPQGSVTLQAAVCEEDDRFVHITVSDTGTGMDAETLDNLFRPDKRVQPDTDNPHGTGFGLILSKFIIKRHDDNTLRGCRIWVESELGKGTTTHVLLEKVVNDGSDL